MLLFRRSKMYNKEIDVVIIGADRQTKSLLQIVHSLAILPAYCMLKLQLYRDR